MASVEMGNTSRDGDRADILPNQLPSDKPEDWIEYFKFKYSRDPASDARNALLVVAALLVQVTFQAGINPPDYIYKKKKKSGDELKVSSSSLTVFLVANTLSLSSAMAMIEYLTANMPYQRELRIAMACMMFAYGWSSGSTEPTMSGYRLYLRFDDVVVWLSYIGVGKSEQVQLFYYFIESERSPENDPLLLWLTGGPGCSALSGLLYEIGPFTINSANSTTGDIPALELNPYAWTKVANIIFLDQPAGTGFSYSKTWEAYRCNDTLSAQYAYSFLIKGYVEGNPLTDKYADNNNRVVYAHRMGLLSDNLYKSTKVNCNGHYLDEHPQNAACQYDLERVSKCTEKINIAQILEPMCSNENLLILDVSSIVENNVTSLPLLQHWCRGDNYLYSSVWANNKIVQKALHVREETITEWVRCNESLMYDSGMERTEAYAYNVQSTLDYHRSFTNKSCRVLIYSGDHDMVVPHVSTEEWIESLKVGVEDEWRPWFVEDQVAGYTMKYSQEEYELTYATIKGAGHTAPEYKPQQCFSMLQRWLSYYPL
nr:serine carboxypeptidase-like 18 isoform X2 [Ipomoea batatas]